MIRKNGKLFLAAIRIQAPEEVEGISDLLHLDSQPVTLPGREIVQALALLPHPPDPPVEQRRGVGGDGAIIVSARPSDFDPLENVDQEPAVAGRRNRVACTSESRRSLLREFLADRARAAGTRGDGARSICLCGGRTTVFASVPFLRSLRELSLPDSNRRSSGRFRSNRVSSPWAQSSVARCRICPMSRVCSAERPNSPSSDCCRRR